MRIDGSLGREEMDREEGSEDHHHHRPISRYSLALSVSYCQVRTASGGTLERSWK
jgi:hypothetical protein